MNLITVDNSFHKFRYMCDFCCKQISENEEVLADLDGVCFKAYYHVKCTALLQKGDMTNATPDNRRNQTGHSEHKTGT
jgi:hypothetical protein